MQKLSKFLLLILFVISAVGGCKRETRETPEITLNLDHPRLHQLVKGKPLKIEEIDRVDWHYNTFIAVVVRPNDNSYQYAGDRSLLLFRRAHEKITLIWDSGPQFYIGLYAEDGFRSGQIGVTEFEGVLETGFADRNSNKVPDLAFLFSRQGGNYSGSQQITILELTNNGGARDITLGFDMPPQGLTDINHDGKSEIIAATGHDSQFGSEAHAGSPYQSKVYEWQSNAYRDASVKFADYYYKENDELRKHIKATYGRPFVSRQVSPLLSQVFFNYEAMQQTKAGWAEVLSLGSLENWNLKNSAPSEINKYRRVLSQLKKMIK